MKKIKLLPYILLIIFFTNCEKELYDNSNFPNQKKTNYEVKKISFGQLKNNRKAFERLNEVRLEKNPSLQFRGVFNDDFGVFVDTTNIVMIENENQHSVTLQIVNDDLTSTTIENLVLISKQDSSYSAFIMEYDLTNQDFDTLADGGTLTDKSPTSITEIQSEARMNIFGDGAGCIEFDTYTVNMCNDGNGGTMIDNGELGNGCVGMPFEVQYTVLTIDADCLSGGGSSGGGDGDSSGSGGIGDGSTSGGSGGGNGTGSSSGTGNTNTEDPNDSSNNDGVSSTLTDENGNPIITTPLLDIDRTEIKLLNSLTPEQNAWWNDPSTSQDVKDDIIDYLNNNSTNGNIEPGAIEFVIGSIEALKEGGEVDLDYQIISDSTFVNSKTDCIHKKVKQNATNVYSLMLKNFNEKTNSNVTFRVGFVQHGEWGITKGSATTSNYEIIISQQVENGSNLMKTVTLCHELIHAYIYNTLEQEGLMHFDSLGEAYLDFDCDSGINYNNVKLNDLSIRERFIAIICAMNQNGTLNQQWTHTLFNISNFSIVTYRQELENFIYNEHDWDDENQAFKDEAISVFGVNWKREVAKSVSWIGLEDTAEYLVYVNSYGSQFQKKLYIANIRNKIINAKNTCQ